ncbi:cold shock domain-containing protein [Micromonospora sp. NPDC049891]|uniref:cold shock domain-containing protein n=1 Tax=Micromonospora sp. NPDC049891 TaxID=3155655 RepID=UPI003404E162
MLAGARQNDRVAGSGVVRIYHSGAGWGVIDGSEVPGGCWVHFSAIAMNGYRQLAAGQRVSFIAEPAAQDGFAYRAVKVWTTETEPVDQQRESSQSRAYDSTLTLTASGAADQYLGAAEAFSVTSHLPSLVACT